MSSLLLLLVSLIFNRRMHRAELYSSSHGLQKRDAAQTLSKYLNLMSWKPGDRILDVGCGPGFVTTQELMPRLPENFSVLVGTDISKTMVQHASTTYMHPKLRFSHLDISSPNINNELYDPGFDKIFSFYCLHWIPEQRSDSQSTFSYLFVFYFHTYLLCYINRFTSLCKNLFNLLEFLAEAFRSRDRQALQIMHMASKSFC